MILYDDADGPKLTNSESGDPPVPPKFKRCPLRRITPSSSASPGNALPPRLPPRHPKSPQPLPITHFIHPPHHRPPRGPPQQSFLPPLTHHGGPTRRTHHHPCRTNARLPLPLRHRPANFADRLSRARYDIGDAPNPACQLILLASPGLTVPTLNPSGSRDHPTPSAPTFLLLCEIDHDAHGHRPEPSSADNFLNGQKRNDPTAPDRLPTPFGPPTNTGLPRDIDLDQRRHTDSPATAGNSGNTPANTHGILKGRYPIDRDRIPPAFNVSLVRSPRPHSAPSIHARTPPITPTAVWQRLRLSPAKKPLSTSPILDSASPAHAARAFHLLASHPPPAGLRRTRSRTDGRNHDEIDFWQD